MALTRKDFTGDGTTTVYDISFDLGYLRKEDIYVSLDSNEYTNQLGYSFLNDTQIVLDAPVSSGVGFNIRRVVDRNTPINDYQEGAILREKNLDDSFAQALMIQQEMEDGYIRVGEKLILDSELDMGGKQIKNVGTPTDPDDAIRLVDAEQLAGQSSGGSTISEEPPTIKSAGDRWTRCSDMKAFLWYEDGDSGQWIEDRPSYGIDTIQKLSIPYVFDTVADMTSSTIVFPVGKRIEWSGYYAKSDGGGNWGIVNSGSHTDDGGSIFTLTNGDYVESSLHGDISILKFGARDRFTGVNNFDNTDRIQALFDYLDTAYMTVNYQSMSAGGGIVFVPSGEYLTTRTLYMGSSTLLYGTGAGSKFRFNPVTSLSFMEPKNKNFGTAETNAHANSNWQMKFRDFYVCVEPTGGVFLGYDGVSNVTEYNRNTLHCFDIYDSMGTNFERVMVTDFWQGTAFKLDRRNEVFTYYNQLNHCITRDCKRDIDTISATGVISGSYSDRTNFPANTLGKDYSIVIGGDVSLGAGTTVSGGVGVEGNANTALILDRGNGTSITGCYFEAKKAPYVIDASSRDSVAGGATYAANHYGFTPAVLLNPIITATGISNYTDSVKLSAGEPMEIKIVEATTRATPSFRSSVEGLTHNPSGGLLLEGTDTFLSGINVELRRGAGTNTTDNQTNYTFLPAETGRGNNMTVWVTLMVRRLNESDTTVRVFNTASGNRDLRPVVVYTNGWELWATYMTMVDGDATTLTVRQNAGSTSPSRKIQFSGLRVYQNGTPSMPSPYPYREAASASPVGGLWTIGETVDNSQPSGAGAASGWTRTSAGFKITSVLS